MELPPVAEKLMRIKGKTPAAKPMESGLGLEKQISTPVEAESFFLTSLFIELTDPQKMVRPERFELPTFWFVARRSIQLS
jgi:hypothetical protein